MTKQQQELWHDTLEDALRSCVEALGGSKKVGSELWPSKPVADAGRLVNHCLDPDRPEKMALAEIVMLLKMARTADCHVGMAFLAGECGYQEPVPVEPDDEKARLQREYVKAVKALDQISKRMKKVEAA